MGGDHGPPVVVPAVARAIARPGRQDVRFLLHGDEARDRGRAGQAPAPPRPLSRSATPSKVIAMRREARPGHAPRQGHQPCGTPSRRCATGEAARRGLGRQHRRPDGHLQADPAHGRRPGAAGPRRQLADAARRHRRARRRRQHRLRRRAAGGVRHHGRGLPPRRPRRRASPRVGLLNVGSEDEKGHEEVREAQPHAARGRLRPRLPRLRRGRRHRQGHGRRGRHRRLHRQRGAEDRGGRWRASSATSCATRFDLGPAGHGWARCWPARRCSKLRATGSSPTPAAPLWA